MLAEYPIGQGTLLRLSGVFLPSPQSGIIEAVSNLFVFFNILGVSVSG